MKEEHYYQTGIYLAYPKSPNLKSIYRQKKYKTEVNETHTKVGIAKNSFKAREKGYLKNFDEEVVFAPLAIIVDLDELKRVEDLILEALRLEFENEKPSREWFRTSNHEKVTEIIIQVLTLNQITHKFIG